MVPLERQLRDRLAGAFAAVAGERVDPALRRSQHADFQADGALALAGRQRRKPRDVAGEVVAALEVDDLCRAVEISGPGFVNLTLREDAVAGLLTTMAADDRLGVAPAEEPETVVVDYSAPNVAKEMHVGHLRSTVIGDAAVRLLEHLGHRVVRANHLGDWGTPFGMLIEHLVDVGESDGAHELSVGDLSGFYRAARAKFDADEAFRERSRARVVALQAGDPATVRHWRLLVEESERYFLAVYDRLDVRLTADDFTGESFYNDRLAAVVDDLSALGLLHESDGALVTFPEGFRNREGDPLPLIVRKRDGGYGYAATDLAAVRFRTGELAARRLVYVVGLPQRDHLAMVFSVARRAGWLVAPARAEHVGFGSVLGTDGKILRSRAGETVRLADLLEEAVTRAGALVATKSPGLAEAEQAAVAHAVGVGAVKYADLSHDRTRDYVFDWARMLAVEGNTGPYLQYAHARARSILRRAGRTADDPAAPPLLLAEPAERALAVELLAFPGTVETVAHSLELHRLTTHLYDLAVAFTGFWEHCPVLRAEGEVRESRLALCRVTARVLARGLGLLGIAAPDRL